LQAILLGDTETDKQTDSIYLARDVTIEWAGMDMSSPLLLDGVPGNDAVLVRFFFWGGE